jgi:hypothetical protein
MFEQLLRQELSDNLGYHDLEDDEDALSSSFISADPQIDIGKFGGWTKLPTRVFGSTAEQRHDNPRHDWVNFQTTYRFDIGELNSSFLERLNHTQHWKLVHTGDLFSHIASTEEVAPNLEFRASRELMNKYIASQIKLRKSEGIPTSELLSEAGATDFISVFSERIRGCLVNWFQEQRSTAAEKKFNLFEANSFLPMMQIRVCDTFMLVPDLSHDFLNALFRDLRQFFLKGGEMKGSWGMLQLQDGNVLELKLDKLQVESVGKFKRAQRIE